MPLYLHVRTRFSMATTVTQTPAASSISNLFPGRTRGASLTSAMSLAFGRNGRAATQADKKAARYKNQGKFEIKGEQQFPDPREFVHTHHDAPDSQSEHQNQRDCDPVAPSSPNPRRRATRHHRRNCNCREGPQKPDHQVRKREVDFLRGCQFGAPSTNS